MGQPGKLPSATASVSTFVRLPLDLRLALEKRRMIEKVSMTQIMVKALEAYIKKAER